MTKVLLIGLNARYSHSNLALLYLREQTRGLPFDIEITEYSIKGDAEKIIGDIVDRNPHAVAFSVYIWNSILTRNILALLHGTAPEIKIILGGPEVSFNAREWLQQFPFIECIITGPGEHAFRQLLEKGLACPEKVLSAPNPHFREIPFPYRDGDFARLAGRYVYYESSRGCPFRCSYCLSSRSDHRLEFRDLDQVKSELDFLAARKVRLVKFVDRTFNARPARSRALWEYLIAAHSHGSTSFHFEIFPSFLDEKDFGLLATAPPGLFQFEMGIQSIHDETLAAVNRGGSWDETAEKIGRMLRPGNIHVHTDIIAGLPHEDRNLFARSFDAIYGLGAHHFQVGILKVLPGTQMRDEAPVLAMEYDPEPPYTIRANRWMSNRDMDEVKGVAVLVDRLYNTGSFSATLKHLEEMHGSPFRCFSELYRFSIEEYTGNRDGHEWKDLAGLVMLYVSHNFPEKYDFITDCLCWDWFTAGRDHRYPSAVAGEFMGREKKRLAGFLQEKNYRDMLKARGVVISPPELKKARFFAARSEEFCRAYLDENRYCLALSPGPVFLPGRE